MELQLPKIDSIVLQDGTSAPFQLTRRRISTEKLPVPPGIRLTLSRGMLGDGLYRPTTDFLRAGPLMRVPDLMYNDLHDPHLRHYFQRQDRCQLLKEGNFITDNNEVICSLKEYNTYEEYLRGLKMVANRTYDETQVTRMEKVMKLQRKGLIPRDVRMEEVIESMLEENSENLRKLLQTNAARKKQKGQTDVENENQQKEEALYNELDFLSWKAEDRTRLMIFEKQFRHEKNREMFLKQVQEQKDRKKQALVGRKCSIIQRKLQEKMQLSREAEMKRCKNEGQDEYFWETPLEQPQRRLPSRPCAKRPVLRSGAARVYGVNASEVFQKLPAVQRNDQRRFLEKDRTSQQSLIEVCKAKIQEEERSEPSLGQAQGLLPLRQRVSRPVVRSGAARVYGNRASEAYQKLPSLALKSSNQ